MRTLLLASALIVGLLGSVAAAPFPGPAPYHPYCRTVWLFATPCSIVNTKVEKQIEAFSSGAGCRDCHYALVSAAPLSITANHTSADGLTVEKITFSFKPSVLTGSCRVSAQSQSLGFSTLFDDGLNYCNLHRLLTVSGLTSLPGFTEMTNEWACLGYGHATCKA